MLFLLYLILANQTLALNCKESNLAQYPCFFQLLIVFFLLVNCAENRFPLLHYMTPRFAILIIIDWLLLCCLDFGNCIGFKWSEPLFIFR